MQTGRNIVRLDAPPVQPLDPSPWSAAPCRTTTRWPAFQCAALHGGLDLQPVYPVPLSPANFAPPSPPAGPNGQVPNPRAARPSAVRPLPSNVPAGASPVGFPQQ